METREEAEEEVRNNLLDLLRFGREEKEILRSREIEMDNEDDVGVEKSDKKKRGKTKGEKINEHMEEGDFTRGGGSSSGGESPSQEPPFWLQIIQKDVEENKKRSVENKRLLVKMDYRTLWISRILIGIFVTVVGGLILQII